MMSGLNRWLPKEVRILLGTVRRSPSVIQLMSSSNQPNEDLWRDISNQLAELGYQRSPDQCRGKWKVLKKQLFRAMEDQNPVSFPYYNKMEGIWVKAGKPLFRERRISVLLLNNKNQVVNTEPQETSSNKRSDTISIPKRTDSERSWSDEEQPSTSNEQGQRANNLLDWPKSPTPPWQRSEDHLDWQRSPTLPEHPVSRETVDSPTSPTHTQVKNESQPRPHHRASVEIQWQQHRTKTRPQEPRTASPLAFRLENLPAAVTPKTASVTSLAPFQTIKVEETEEEIGEPQPSTSRQQNSTLPERQQGETPPGGQQRKALAEPQSEKPWETQQDLQHGPEEQLNPDPKNQPLPSFSISDAIERGKEVKVDLGREIREKALRGPLIHHQKAEKDCLTHKAQHAQQQTQHQAQQIQYHTQQAQHHAQQIQYHMQQAQFHTQQAQNQAQQAQHHIQQVQYHMHQAHKA
uniref:Myb-like protein Q isoform X2 n=1 Tax=Geotrypetes seraphini TaxID=260995 RepID=A0A6P8QVQ3_GEOSA|nr:myb-like protein Q isoform X2 [Geotrypetes seraphini]